MKKIILFLFFNFIILTYFAQQNTIDSLRVVLKTAKEDTNKVNTLNSLSETLTKTSDYEQAKKQADLAFTLSEKLNFTIGKANAYYNIGIIYRYQGNYSDALKNYSSSLKIRKKIGDKKGIASSYNSIGIIYDFQGNYPEALKNYYAALKIREEIEDKQGMASSYNNIGIIYNFQENYPEALKNYFASLKIREKIGDKKGVATSYINIGLVYRNQGKYSESLKNYYASLSIYEELGDKYGIGRCYHNIAGTYSEEGNHKEALKNYFTTIKIEEEIGDKYGIAMSSINVGGIYVELNKFNEAKKYLDNALTLSKELNSKNNIAYSYYNLSALDSVQGNWKSAYNHHKLYIVYRDSIDNEETKEKTIQASMNYEFEKKEALTKAAQDKKDVLVATELKKQQIIRYSIIGILIIVILFTLYLYNRFRLIRKQKNIIELKEKETQEQKDIIEEKHREITDSINYAERIQRSFLASSEILDKNLQDYFVFFRPKNVVSGDFYWAGELKNGNFAFSCADSTGHGVPGAIMSILNISSLEKSIEQETEPNKILNKTRKIIIERLKKDGSPEGGKDGMDCSLMVINKDKTQLSFAAANNPVFIVRNNELIEFKPDKMPVGKHDKDVESFNLQTTHLQKGDIIYTLTDGFSDQFGGDKGKKYMIKSLKALLMQIAPLTMKEQEQKLSEEFIAWKGENEQVDDVCIIGVKI